MALNLTEDELQLLASLPQSIGSAVAFAGRSGLFGTGKEMFASGQALMAGAKDYPGNELIQAIVPDPNAADKSAELAAGPQDARLGHGPHEGQGHHLGREADRADAGRRPRSRATAGQQGRPGAGRRSTASGRWAWPTRWPWRRPRAVFWALAARACRTTKRRSSPICAALGA